MGLSDYLVCDSCRTPADDGHAIDCPRMKWETWYGVGTASSEDHNLMYQRYFRTSPWLAEWYFIIEESECGHIRTRGAANEEERQGAANGIWCLAEMDAVLRETLPAAILYEETRDGIRKRKMHDLFEAMKINVAQRGGR